MIDEILDESTDRIVKPRKPKRWRNKWRTLVPFIGATNNDLKSPGDEFFSMFYPSKDIAETEAKKIIDRNFLIAGFHATEWLGAFEED